MPLVCIIPLILPSRSITPANPLQPGPIYFLTPRKAAKAALFPDRSTSYRRGFRCWEGANAVVSMLDYFFNHHGLGETSVMLHADNCTGHNKNNTMMQYLMWRVSTGLHHKITIFFMVVGHTKFAPDGCFGMACSREPSVRAVLLTLSKLFNLRQWSTSVNLLAARQVM